MFVWREQCREVDEPAWGMGAQDLHQMGPVRTAPETAERLKEREIRFPGSIVLDALSMAH
jgi:hypothetical protein